MNNTKKNRWAVVQLALVDQGLTYEQAALLHFIGKFQKSSGPVFASIPYIAREMRLSERSVQRHIRTLIKLEFLVESSNGRNRWLKMNDAKLAGKHAKLAPIHAKMAPRDAKLAPYACQNGILSTEYISTEYISTEDDIQKLSTDPKKAMHRESLVEKKAYLELKKSLLLKMPDL